MWEKSKGNNKMWEKNVTCDVGTAQYEYETVKCEEKNKRTTQCDKRTFMWQKYSRCDIGTT